MMTGNGCRLLAIVLLLVCARASAQTPREIIEAGPWVTKTIGTGVEWKRCQFPSLFGAKQNINVVTANLTQPNVFVRFPYLPGSGRQVVSEFGIREGGAAAVVNGNFSEPGGDEPSVQYFKVDGKLVTPTLSPEIADAAGIAVGADGAVRVLRRPAAGWESLTEPSVMATNVDLLIGDELTLYPAIPFYQSDRHPRTAVGVTAQGHLMLVTVDGRRATTVAAGMSFLELQQTMAALGCRDAINMDGGGSTTMWVRGEPGNGVVNTVSGSSQRVLPNTIAIIAPAPPGGYAWDARLTSSSLPANMTSGATAEGWIEFRNYGTQTWTAMTRLGTLAPMDRSSPFYVDGNWLAPWRPTGAAATTPPGSVARFNFRLRAPVVAEPTLFNEDFGILEEFVAWFRGMKLVARFPILVEPVPPDPSTGTGPLWDQIR